MMINSEYYSVQINIFPFQFGKEKEIGCYSEMDIAERVAKWIRVTFEQTVAGGMDISIRNYKAEMIKTSVGLRLKETPNGKITLIQEDLSETEMQRLLDLLPILLQSSLMRTKILASTCDAPKYLCEGQYHCVVLDFRPFDRSNRLFVGYYQTRTTALSVSKYIQQIHFNRKIGSGFDIKIETYEGNFIEYESGKQWIKIEGKFHEIQSSCNMNDFLKLSKEINQAIGEKS